MRFTVRAEGHEKEVRRHLDEMLANPRLGPGDYVHLQYLDAVRHWKAAMEREVAEAARALTNVDLELLRALPRPKEDA